MTDPVLASRVRRTSWLCRRGAHRMVLITRVKIDDEYRTVRRCRRCGLVRHETGRL